MATSQKISIVGTESAGKTVFLAAITHALSAQATFPRISTKNVLTVRYTAEVYDQLELGKWPKSTDVGVRQNLGWLWHARDQSKHELQTFDCAGQDFRTIFESESDDELNTQQLALKKEFYESDLILLLINLQRALDIYKVPGKNSERINIEFAAATAVRKLRKQGVTIYALFTQYDRCRERVERDWNGDISLALKTLLPDLHAALLETGSAFAAIAAIDTEPRDGEILPKVGCQTGDLSAIVTGIDDFLVKNAPLAAQREQRRLAEEEKRKEKLLQEQVKNEKSLSDNVAIPNSLPDLIPEQGVPKTNVPLPSSKPVPPTSSETSIPPQTQPQPPAGALPYSFSYSEVVLGKFATFKGRASRKEYWSFWLCNVLMSSAILAISDILGNIRNINRDLIWGIPAVFFPIFFLVIILPSISVTVRRLHDIGRSGWWCWINLIPYVGSFIFLIFLLSNSKDEGNKYGPNPKWREKKAT